MCCQYTFIGDHAKDIVSAAAVFQKTIDPAPSKRAITIFTSTLLLDMSEGPINMNIYEWGWA